MVKIIGFMKNVDHYKTIAGKMKSTVFINSCKAVAKRTEAPFALYYTKRQCSKFFRGCGVVFDEIANG